MVYKLYISIQHKNTYIVYGTSEYEEYFGNI